MNLVQIIQKRKHLKIHVQKRKYLKLCKHIGKLYTGTFKKH